MFSSSLPWQQPYPVLCTVEPWSSLCPWRLYECCLFESSYYFASFFVVCNVNSRAATKWVAASIRANTVATPIPYLLRPNVPLRHHCLLASLHHDNCAPIKRHIRSHYRHGLGSLLKVKSMKICKRKAAIALCKITHSAYIADYSTQYSYCMHYLPNKDPNEPSALSGPNIGVYSYLALHVEVHTQTGIYHRAN